MMLVTLCGHANAHQWTPTYFDFRISFVQGVYKSSFELLNMRKDVEYYQIGVFDDKWNSIPYASEDRNVRVGYLQRKVVNVYIRQEDVARTVYVCSESRLAKLSPGVTAVASRICSKKK